jgi:hypothetical protein
VALRRKGFIYDEFKSLELHEKHGAATLNLGTALNLLEYRGELKESIPTLI